MQAFCSDNMEIVCKYQNFHRKCFMLITNWSEKNFEISALLNISQQNKFRNCVPQVY